ncbi:hypothetical protein PWT90_05507 [Aphanocladium album]|nr:hypothetical protein PWT90_05507 [Aphanocladium album]
MNGSCLIEDQDGAIDLQRAVEPLEVLGWIILIRVVPRRPEPNQRPAEPAGDARPVPRQADEEGADDAGHARQKRQLLVPVAVAAAAEDGEDGDDARRGEGAELQQREGARNVRVEHDDPDARAHKRRQQDGHADVDLDLRGKVKVEHGDARQHEQQPEAQLPEEAAQAAAADDKVVEEVEDEEPLDHGAHERDAHHAAGQRALGGSSTAYGGGPGCGGEQVSGME